MFNQSSVAISGGNFTLYNTQGASDGGPVEAIVAKAFEHVAFSAMHDNNDEQEAPKCHPGTRTAFILRLIDWVRGADPSPTCRLLWITGPAGSGKSAIVRSVAYELERASVHLATFFFFKADATRNSVKALALTLAYQLYDVMPSFRPHFRQALLDNPAVTNRSLATQFEKLITAPLVRMLSNALQQDHMPVQPIVFFIDGLDECLDEGSRCRFLQVLRYTIPHLNNVRFIIASRPEPDIEIEIGLFRGDVLRKVELLADLSAYEDIRRFLRDEFASIRLRYPIRNLIPNDWPSPMDIEALVRKSSGYFIYPATAMKYVGSFLDNPQRSLQVILGLRASTRNPLAELDALYRSILQASNTDPQRLLSILSILSASFQVLPDCFRNFSTHQVEEMLDLEEGDVELALLRLRSIIKVEPAAMELEQEAEETIEVTHRARSQQLLSFHHRSFHDFLMDSERSLDYAVDPQAAMCAVIKGCLRALSKISKARASKSNFYHSVLVECFSLFTKRFGHAMNELRDDLMGYDPLNAGPNASHFWGRFLTICEYLKIHHDDDVLFQYHLSKLDAFLLSDVQAMPWPHDITRNLLALRILPESLSGSLIPLDTDQAPVTSTVADLSKILHPEILLNHFSFAEGYFRFIGGFFFDKDRSGVHCIDEESLCTATKWCLDNLLRLSEAMSMSMESTGSTDGTVTEVRLSEAQSAWAFATCSLLMRQIYRPVRLSADVLVLVPRIAKVAEDLRAFSHFDRLEKFIALKTIMRYALLHLDPVPTERLRYVTASGDSDGGSRILEYSGLVPDIDVAALQAHTDSSFDGSAWTRTALDDAEQFHDLHRICPDEKEIVVFVNLERGRTWRRNSEDVSS